MIHRNGTNEIYSISSTSKIENLKMRHSYGKLPRTKNCARHRVGAVGPPSGCRRATEWVPSGYPQWVPSVHRVGAVRPPSGCRRVTEWVPSGDRVGAVGPPTWTLTLPCRISCRRFMSGGLWEMTLFRSWTLFSISSIATCGGVGMESLGDGAMKWGSQQTRRRGDEEVRKCASRWEINKIRNERTNEGNERTHTRTNDWMNAHTSERTNEQANEQTNEQRHAPGRPAGTSWSLTSTGVSSYCSSWTTKILFFT